MGFDSALSSSHNLASRLGQAVRGDHRPSQLIAVATDGETFGHHKGGTEKCLSYAFTQEFVDRGWTVTNFRPLPVPQPTHLGSGTEARHRLELRPRSRSLAGRLRLRRAKAAGISSWRKPLRLALDWLRDRASASLRNCGQQTTDRSLAGAG